MPAIYSPSLHFGSALPVKAEGFGGGPAGFGGGAGWDAKAETLTNIDAVSRVANLRIDQSSPSNCAQHISSSSRFPASTQQFCGHGFLGRGIRPGHALMCFGQSSNFTPSSKPPTRPRTEMPASCTVSARPDTSGCHQGKSLPSSTSL